ncbi:MAG TPA: iron-sulfur cluster assembly scaffold protein [Candidatus Paceibacterota bacterium]
MMAHRRHAPDVTSCGQGQSWLYTDIVKDHFFHPRNLLLDDTGYVADGVGLVGSPACGDMMLVWIKVDPTGTRIADCKWRTFGCASAIASTSMMSVMATEHGGMTLHHAKTLKPQHILERLGGLPERKFHCSVLGQEALRDAVLDYERKQGSAVSSSHS